MKKQAHELNREFSKEDVQMANKYIRKCSNSLAIKEISSHPIRFHLTPVRKVVIKNTNNKCW
jgi:hypothetical protein